MIGVVQALDALRGVSDRGFRFSGAKGPGEDLFLSFDQLRTEALKRAAHLRSLGLTKGDRVALVLPDGQDFIPAFFGALWAGIIPVPLYPPISLGKLDVFMEALVNILQVAEPKALITSDRIAKVLWSAVGRVPSLQKVALADELAAAAPIDPPAYPDDSDVAFLQFTSGSTAAPKGVMVTHGNLKANTHAIGRVGLQIDPTKDLAVSWLPLYHDMGLIGCVLVPVVAGVTMVLIPTISFIKNATVWLDTISRHGASLTFAPNFAYALTVKRARPEQIARWDLSRMRAFGCGAEPINAEVLRSFVRAFAPAGLKPTALLPCYGMAEATLAMSFVGLSDELKTDRIDPERYHSEKRAAAASNGTSVEIVCCGRAFPGHELSIQDERGRILPDRAVGEICFRGPSVTAGYWKNPQATRAAGLHEPGGWLRTGDLGYMVDGEIYISGRLKDMLIVNGRNYYPQTIEWAVEQIVGVRRGSAVAFSRPGKASEEVVVAVETRERDAEKLRSAIISKVSEDVQLAVADVALLPPGSIPKTSSGKLQRRKTRDLYLNGALGRDGVRVFGPMGNRLLAAKHLAYSLVGRARHEARGLVRKLTGA
ncbi:MAG TPA: fatty acyl-AMP ligase [Myxococcales bacterium]|nr:fatty acyl-AMP ligase [Myxococcales bacterium]